jgi:hypothetical protein
MATLISLLLFAMACGPGLAEQCRIRYTFRQPHPLVPERRVEIRDQIVGILDPDRQTDQRIVDAE